MVRNPLFVFVYSIKILIQTFLLFLMESIFKTSEQDQNGCPYDFAFDADLMSDFDSAAGARLLSEEPVRYALVTEHMAAAEAPGSNQVVQTNGTHKSFELLFTCLGLCRWFHHYGVNSLPGCLLFLSQINGIR